MYGHNCEDFAYDTVSGDADLRNIKMCAWCYRELPKKESKK